MKRFLLLHVFIIAMFFSCGKNDEETSIPQVNVIEISEKNKIINVGDSILFSLSYSPSIAVKPSFVWKSSDNKIATIDTTGLLKGISDGEVVVKVSTKNDPLIFDEATVVILPIEPQSIMIDSVANIYYDGSKCFTVKYYPGNAKKQEIIWCSSNESVASVSEYGCVKVNGVGSTVITGTIKGTNISTSCKVSINHKNPNRQSVQCVATTNAGTRCKRMTTNLNARCWQH